MGGEGEAEEEIALAPSPALPPGEGGVFAKQALQKATRESITLDRKIGCGLICFSGIGIDKKGLGSPNKRPYLF